MLLGAHCYAEGLHVEAITPFLMVLLLCFKLLPLIGAWGHQSLLSSLTIPLLFSLPSFVLPYPNKLTSPKVEGGGGVGGGKGG